MVAETSVVDMHTLVEAATAVMVFGGFVVTLLIKAHQSEAGATMLAAQNQMREDMDAKHAENRQAIAVHEAGDKVQFDSISRTLTRIETKVEHLATRV